MLKQVKNGYFQLTSRFIALHNLYIPALLLLVLLTLYHHYFELHLTNSLKNDGTIINIAGRQRMLSQVLQLLALEYYQNQTQENKNLLLKEMDLFQKSHIYLLNNFHTNTDAFKYETKNSELYFNQYLYELYAFLNDKDQTRIINIKSLSKKLLTELSQLVYNYELYNKERVTNLEEKQQFLVILFLILVILEIAFIFYPASKKIQQNKDELETSINDKTIKVQKTLSLLSTYVIYSKTDINGIITDVSDAFCAISGYTRDELIGKNHNIVRHPDMPSSLFSELWSTLNSGLTFNGKIKNLKKDGSHYWVDAHIEPEFDKYGKFFSCISIRKNITDQEAIQELNKNLQQKINNAVKEHTAEQTKMLTLIKQQKEYLSTIIESNNNAIIAIDKTKTILTYNKKAQEIFGFTQEEMIGTKNLLEIIPLKYKNLHQLACSSYFQTGKSTGIISSTLELEGITKNQTTIPIRISFGSNNGIVIANITDISKEKEQEKQLAEQSHLVQMGEMLSMISHQWRQPLASIGNASYGVQVKIRTGAFDLQNSLGVIKLIEYIEKKHTNINEYVQFLSNTIDDFRNFFKPNQKKELTQLKLLIEKTLQLIDNLLKSNNITIYKKFTSETPLYIHKNEIMQVLLNILHNAIDNFKDKNIGNPEIKIETKEEGEYLLISISDNGGGIEDKIIQNIFNPYFSTKDEKNGTGLGLYMSKMIIDKHDGGTLNAINIDNGVKFEIKFRRDIEAK